MNEEIRQELIRQSKYIEFMLKLTWPMASCRIEIMVSCFYLWASIPSPEGPDSGMETWGIFQYYTPTNEIFIASLDENRYHRHEGSPEEIGLLFFGKNRNIISVSPLSLLIENQIDQETNIFIEDLTDESKY